MFEAIHGSAPRRAGHNMANPSGLLHGALLMLVHIGQSEAAEKAHNAWLSTIEEGIHTYDIYRDGVSTRKVGTREFGDAVIERIGRNPGKLHAVEYNKAIHMNLAIRPAGKPPMKMRVGVDVFIDRRDGNPDIIAGAMQLLAVPGTKLTVISNRGTKVWPDPNPDTYWSDHWSCRFESDGSELFTAQHVVQLLDAADRAGFDVIKTEGLYTFNGERGYSLAQGQ
jgi:isocitrate dehydrogenase